MKILVIHGAGMDMRGKAHIDIWGPMTLPEYDAKIRTFAQELSVEIEIFHSNIEGEVINRLFAAHDEGIAGAIINPSGYTRGYPALVAAIGNVGFPTIEVHLPWLRHWLRHRRLRPGLARPQGEGAGQGVIMRLLLTKGLFARSERALETQTQQPICVPRQAGPF
jgi:3-dehydroquinate dehydratase-2